MSQPPVMRVTAKLPANSLESDLSQVNLASEKRETQASRSAGRLLDSVNLTPLVSVLVHSLLTYSLLRDWMLPLAMRAPEWLAWAWSLPLWAISPVAWDRKLCQQQTVESGTEQPAWQPCRAFEPLVPGGVEPSAIVPPPWDLLSRHPLRSFPRRA
jgi:hypothetical protein